MSETTITSEAAVLEPRHYTLRQLLFPSVVSGVVLGVVGAVVVYFIVRALQPDNYDAQVVFAYTGWTLFFFAGIGAFNGIWRWGFARHDDTLEEALDLAGKDQGLWRYFRYTTDHKVVGMQYLATVLVLFFVGSMGAFSIRRKRDRKSTRLNSSHTVISYAVFCLKKKKKKKKNNRSIDKKTKQMSHA